MPDDRYVMLVTSLPHLGPLLPARQTPMSRPALERRLHQLDPPDRALLNRIEGVIAWSRIGFEDSDRALIVRARALLADLDRPTLRPTLRSAVEHRLEVRTAVAALRRRRRDRPPDPHTLWGLGWTARVIERNWLEPQFGLERRLPWLPEARSLLEAGDSRGLERLLLQVVWRHLERLAADHAFDIEAVVLYVLRWRLIDRWTRADAAAGARRFRSMVDGIMAAAPPPGEPAGA